MISNVVCVCESVAGTIFCASQDSNLQKLYAIQFLRFYLHQFRFCFIVSLTFFRNRFGFFKNAATYRTHTIFDKTRKTLYTPASSARFVTYRMFVKPFFFLNLPGWRWGSITQNPLVAVSRPLHSGVCETRQDIGLPVLHSEISDSGLLRTRGDQQYHKQFLNEPRVIERVDALCFFFVFAFL